MGAPRCPAARSICGVSMPGFCRPQPAARAALALTRPPWRPQERSTALSPVPVRCAARPPRSPPRRRARSPAAALAGASSTTGASSTSVSSGAAEDRADLAARPQLHPSPPCRPRAAAAAPPARLELALAAAASWRAAYAAARRARHRRSGRSQRSIRALARGAAPRGAAPPVRWPRRRRGPSPASARRQQRALAAS
jgi:hypothetical protein